MDLTAENTFSDAILIRPGETFDVSIAGTFDATVTVQRSKDNSTWRDVEAFEEPTEKVGVGGAAQYWRVGIKTGDFSSGTATVAIY